MGLHRYELVPEASGLELGTNGFTLSAMHQDQVLVKPEKPMFWPIPLLPLRGSAVRQPHSDIAGTS